MDQLTPFSATNRIGLGLLISCQNVSKAMQHHFEVFGGHTDIVSSHLYSREEYCTLQVVLPNLEKGGEMELSRRLGYASRLLPTMVWECPVTLQRWLYGTFRCSLSLFRLKMLLFLLLSIKSPTLLRTGSHRPFHCKNGESC